MYWAGEDAMPCYVDDRAPDGALFVMDEPATLMLEPGWWLQRKLIIGTRRTWDALLSHNIARAYRPEGVPW